MTMLSTSDETSGVQLPLRVQAYLEALVKACAQEGQSLVSLVLFGSAARGGFSEDVSDVDLIIVLPDDATRENRRRLREDVARLEAVHGFVLSGLLASGVLYLRATEKLSDRVFQPLAAVVCDSGEQLATSYKWVDQSPRREFGGRRVAQGQVAALNVAECVGQSGDRRPAPGFLVVVWLAAAASVGCLVLLAWLGRRVPDRKSAQRLISSRRTSA